ncbi:TPA: cysteine desulfurase SufS [Escherichia coli]|nr:cysteine desulfurase SufS [Escherichia coli]
MSRNTEATDDVKTWTGGPLNYKEGFFTQLATDELAKGINEEVVRAISAKRNEPEWMLKFRLNAYRAWLEMEEPHWLKAHYDKLNYQDYSYYSAPSCGNCDDTCASEPGAVQQTGANAFLSKEVEAAFEQLGVPVREGKEVAVDAIFDSVSVATTYREKLAEQGIIFCSFGEAIHDHPELVRKYLGTVVPGNDNFFAALNAAVASDGTFIYVPKGVRCPMELSTYFRINAEKTGQFERTILVADEDSYVSYIEGCSAPVRDSYQLHAAVVEVIIHKNAEVKYSTVQNWFPGDNNTGGILNFVTKRALCEGENSKMSWTQSETGSAITWKYPSCILRGDNSIGEFYSVALTSGHQQADTGTKMIHIGKNTKWASLFINARSAEELVFVRGTTEGINLVANSWGNSNVRAGDNIIISQMEHHANIVPWQMLCARVGAELRVIPLNPDGTLQLETLPTLFDEKTRLLAITHVSNVLGTENPLAEMITLAHQHGAKVLVDGAQAVMHHPVDVQALDCDFYVFSGHKLYGPTGIGILYVKEALLQEMPPWEGGGSMIATVSLSEGTTWTKAPWRFEAGTPNTGGIIGLGAALEYVSALGLNNIAEYEQNLMHYALSQLESVPDLTLYGPQNRLGVIAFNLGKHHAYDVGSFLDNYGIAVRTGHHCAMPLMAYYNVPAMCRASLAMYNTHEEVDRLVTGLQRIHRLLG